MGTLQRFIVSGSGCGIGLCLLLLLFSAVSHAEIGNPTGIPPLLTIGGSLLDWVDLDRSDLEQVRALATEGRREEALRSLLQYFRVSQRPRLSEDEPEPVPLADTTIAEQALRREITVQNVTTVLRAWNQIERRDKEWNWAMQRHSWWLDVARAYFDTRDERYASFLNGIILDWFLSNPLPTQDATRVMRPAPTAWRTLEVGDRLAGSWPEVFLYLRASPSLTDEALAAFLRSCHEQAEYLIKYPKASKWLLTESSGLLTTAVLYPEFRRAEEWLDVAASRLEGLTHDQILPDGSHMCASLGYLFPCLSSFARAAHLHRMNSLDPPRVFDETVLQGLAYSIGIVEPSLFLPALNDSDRLYLPDMLEEFGAGLPSIPEIEYFRSERSEGYPPPVTSSYFPFAGHFVFRESWDPDALYALFDVGVFGNIQAHEDRLQFELAAFGETLLGDMGRSTYEPGPTRDYFMGTESHNCILVDGHGMNFRSLPPSTWLTRSALSWPHQLQTEVQWAQATYDGPWQGGEALGIRWTRRFTFVVPSGLLPGCWLVSDRIEGKVEHRVDQLLNFYPGQVSVDAESHRVHYQRNGVQLVVQALADQPLEVLVVQGEERPFRGWFSPYRGSAEPAPSVRIAGKSTLPVRRDMVLMPYRVGESCPLLSARRVGNNVVCNTVGGTLVISAPFLEKQE